MRIAVSVLAILFGLLHIIAAATQFKSKDPAARGIAVAMACGGICLAANAVAHLVGNNFGNASTAAVGCLLICVSAYNNGKRSEAFHPVHHIVRGALSVLLVIGFFIW